MTKLKAYQQSISDLQVINLTLDVLTQQVEQIGNVTVSSSVTINIASSELQFIYAIGILNSQIIASEELGISSILRQKDKLNCKTLLILKKELSDWIEYKCEMEQYNKSVGKLLTEKEKFSLLVYPTR
jgi:hypothetical protein